MQAIRIGALLMAVAAVGGMSPASAQRYTAPPAPRIEIPPRVDRPLEPRDLRIESQPNPLRPVEPIEPSVQERSVLPRPTPGDERTVGGVEHKPSAPEAK